MKKELQKQVSKKIRAYQMRMYRFGRDCLDLVCEDRYLDGTYMVYDPDKDDLIHMIIGIKRKEEQKKLAREVYALYKAKESSNQKVIASPVFKEAVETSKPQRETKTSDNHFFVSF